MPGLRDLPGHLHLNFRILQNQQNVDIVDVRCWMNYCLYLCVCFKIFMVKRFLKIAPTAGDQAYPHFPRQSQVHIIVLYSRNIINLKYRQM